MRLSSISFISALMAAALCTATQTTDFDPITSPGKGDVVHQGSAYTIKWSYKSDLDSGKHVTLELEQGNSTTSAKNIDKIATNVTANDKEYKWDVGSGADVGDNYFIKISYSDNRSVFAYSDKFKLGAVSSNEKSTSTTSGATHTKSSSPTSATKSNAASIPTQFAHAPVAMAGVAAVGIFAL